MTNYTTPIKIYYQFAFFLCFTPFLVTTTRQGSKFVIRKFTLQMITCLIQYMLRLYWNVGDFYNQFQKLRSHSKQTPGDPIIIIELSSAAINIVNILLTFHLHFCKQKLYLRFANLLLRFSNRHYPNGKLGFQKFFLSPGFIFPATLLCFVLGAILPGLMTPIFASPADILKMFKTSILWFRQENVTGATIQDSVPHTLARIVFCLFMLVVTVQNGFMALSVGIYMLVFCAIGVDCSAEIGAGSIGINSAYKRFRDMWRMAREYGKVFGMWLVSKVMQDAMFCALLLVTHWGSYGVTTAYTLYLVVTFADITAVYVLAVVFSQKVLRIDRLASNDRNRDSVNMYAIIKHGVSNRCCCVRAIVIPINCQSMFHIIMIVMNIFILAASPLCT